MRKEFKQYLLWIKSHRNIKKGEYKKPRTCIKKDNVILKIEELTIEEIEEIKYGRWWAQYPEERIIYEKNIGKELEEIPEKERKIVEILRIIHSRLKPIMHADFKQYVEWIEKHKDKETGKYRKPTSYIKKDGKLCNVHEEMTNEEEEEFRLANWWSHFPDERIIYENNIGKELEEIPEKERKIVEQIRKFGFKDKVKKSIDESQTPKINFEEYIKIIEQQDDKKIQEDKSMYLQYINWIKEHKDEDTGEYRKPRTKIYEKAKTVKKELTEDEIEEINLGKWWKLESEERRILEKNLYISSNEFAKLPEDVKEIILLYSETGIKDKYNIVERMQIVVGKNKTTNPDAREELKKVIHKIDKNFDDR